MQPTYLSGSKISVRMDGLNASDRDSIEALAQHRMISAKGAKSFLPQNLSSHLLALVSKDEDGNLLVFCVMQTLGKRADSLTTDKIEEVVNIYQIMLSMETLKRSGLIECPQFSVLDMLDPNRMQQIRFNNLPDRTGL